jgi:hypothetical protein
MTCREDLHAGDCEALPVQHASSLVLLVTAPWLVTRILPDPHGLDVIDRCHFMFAYAIVHSDCIYLMLALVSEVRLYICYINIGRREIKKVLATT